MVKNIVNFVLGFTFTKRQRFILSVVILSIGLFFSESFRVEQSGFSVSIILALLTGMLLFWANQRDVIDNYSPMIFILPFVYTFSFGLFYQLLHDRILSRLILTTIYGIGLYSLFLSQNIFIVASIRTIALLSSARLVSTILMLLSYAFLSVTVFSFHFFLFPTALIVFIYSFLIISHAIWMYTLEKSPFTHLSWVSLLALAMVEVGIVLWFWPSLPALIAIFLTGFFYSLVGLSHLWYEKRLFKAGLWEYTWWTIIVLVLLIFFTFVFPLNNQ